MSENNTIKKVNSDGQLIKKAGQGAEQTNKTADTSIKTVKRTTKTAQQTAKRTAETAKHTKEAAEATVKAYAKVTQIVAKAIAQAGKATVEGIKGIGTTIAAGGVPAIVFIVTVCLVGAIGATGFGIFLSNDESTGSQITMTQAISQLTSEHYSNLTAMKLSQNHDVLEIEGNTTINWKETLAVYAIKTTSSDNPLEVVTINDEKLELLREILKDMNPMTGVVTSRVVPETTITTDEDGNQTVTTNYASKRVHTDTIVQLSSEQIATLYHFNSEQKSTA